MTALSALMLREPVGRHRWGAVLVGFVGVLIMVRPEPGHMNLVGVSLGARRRGRQRPGPWSPIRQIADTEKGATIVFYFTLAGTLLGLVGLAVPLGDAGPADAGAAGPRRPDRRASASCC